MSGYPGLIGTFLIPEPPSEKFANRYALAHLHTLESLRQPLRSNTLRNRMQGIARYPCTLPATTQLYVTVALPLNTG